MGKQIFLLEIGIAIKILFNCYVNVKIFEI